MNCEEWHQFNGGLPGGGGRGGRPQNRLDMEPGSSAANLALTNNARNNAVNAARNAVNNMRPGRAREHLDAELRRLEQPSLRDPDSPELEAARLSAESNVAGQIRNLANRSRCPTVDSYARPSGFRDGVRDQVWNDAKDQYGNVRDPQTGRFMSKNSPWDMGHRPGNEFRRHVESARERDLSRSEFLNEHNNPQNYRPELPSSNRNHRSEL